MDKSRAPKWHKWKHIPQAKLWECVALSLSIEPGKIRHASDSWMVGSHLFRESEEFDDRLDISGRNLVFNESTNPSGLKGETIIMGDPPDCEVIIHKFAAWAIAIGWKIPKELSAMAEVTPDIDHAEPHEEFSLADSVYWRNFESLAQKSVQEFPAWRKTVSKVQKTGNLHEWLTSDLGADNREAEILKKVLSGFFPELN